ncbi:MAG TPA: hypothetical protein VFX59_08085 [Polyangiales bacterium]|nr:hypothetical protein [Polyangiales bacterium]
MSRFDWSSRLKNAAWSYALRSRPIIKLGERFPGVTVLTRRDDVADVFARHEEFSVATYGVRLKACIGPSVLGMADGPVYRRELNLMRSVVRREDAALIRGLVAGFAGELIDQSTRYKARIDLVSELCDPIALRFIESYYGLPDPGQGQLLRWLRMLSYYVFNLYFLTGPKVEIPTIRGCESLLAHAQQVARSREGQSDERDILGRLLGRVRDPALGFDVNDVARILLSFISGGTPRSSRVGRPAHERLLFGDSLHRCFGEHIGMELVTQVVKSVLALPQLTRAPGAEGRVQTGDKDRYPDFFYPARMMADVNREESSDASDAHRHGFQAAAAAE